MTSEEKKKYANSKWGRQAYTVDSIEIEKSVILCGCLWVMCFSREKQVSVSLQALCSQHEAIVAVALASLQKLP